MTDEKTTQDTQKPPETKEPPKDNLVESKHTITINGQLINYTVTCGTIVLKEEVEKKGENAGETEGEKPKAAIFFIAYTRDVSPDAPDLGQRPLTFSFNGGPGSSSVWLHLGVLGPRRVLMGDAGSLLPPPYHLDDNPYSLLDKTDLVFIDPVSTGYSRPVVGEKARNFHGLKRDIESVGDFIRLYVTRYQRWGSPKFLAGESYGTTRASGLSGYLQQRHGLYLNGIMLISSVLNFQTLEFEDGNDLLPYVLFLPTYTATAWYHKRLPADLQADLYKALKESETFAQGDYLLALIKGASMSDAERKKVIQKLSRLTGLSAEYIERTNLRIQIFRFTKELLRSQGRTVGRLDTRFTGFDRDAAGEHFEADPSMDAIMGPYTAAFNQYVRGELKFESDLPYEILANVWETWSYSDHENKYVEVVEALRRAMHMNPYLKVHVASGYFDLATPYLAAEYTFNQIQLAKDLRRNISKSYYEAGHMMYVHEPSLAKLKDELAKFIAEASSQS